MSTPSFFTAEWLTPRLQGAAAGFALAVVLGFNWIGYGFGWHLGSSVDKVAKSRSDVAVVKALAPGCAAGLAARTDAGVMLAALSKTTGGWDRRNVFKDDESKRLITLPGETYPSSDLADACASLALKKTAAVN